MLSFMEMFVCFCVGNVGRKEKVRRSEMKEEKEIKTKEDKVEDTSKVFIDFYDKLIDYGIKNKLEKDTELADVMLISFVALLNKLYGENSLHQLIQMAHLTSRKQMIKNPNEYMASLDVGKKSKNKSDYIG